MAQRNDYRRPRCRHSGQPVYPATAPAYAFASAPHATTTKNLYSRFLPFCVEHVYGFLAAFPAVNFGSVFLGRFSNDYSVTGTDIVVKCPVDSDLGRMLYVMEWFTNRKLAGRSSTQFPPYLAKLLIPTARPIVQVLARLQLVWRHSASTNTVQIYLTTGKISVLAQLLSTSPSATPLRTTPFTACHTVRRSAASTRRHHRRHRRCRYFAQVSPFYPCSSCCTLHPALHFPCLNYKCRF